MVHGTRHTVTDSCLDKNMLKAAVQIICAQLCSLWKGKGSKLDLKDWDANLLEALVT